MAAHITRGFAWQRDLTDLRDTGPQDVGALLGGLASAGDRPPQVDWREYCPAVTDQGQLPASAAHACAAMLQSLERRASGNVIDPSRLFLHLAAARLAHPGESQASIRTLWKGVIRFGIPPERLFPSTLPAPEGPLPAHCFAFTDDVRELSYIRFDTRGEAGNRTLQCMLDWLAAGFPCVFGLPLYTCLTSDHEIAFPTRYDQLLGGHVLMAVGYDDERRIRSDKGALLVRNSWGTAWGEQGYGWLPYYYVRQQFVADCWTLLKPDWIASGEFSRPAMC